MFKTKISTPFQLTTRRPVIWTHTPIPTAPSAVATVVQLPQRTVTVRPSQTQAPARPTGTDDANVVYSRAA